jgi:2-oxoglutarate ferredoxin oxidoreductase subunit alpha
MAVDSSSFVETPVRVRSQAPPNEDYVPYQFKKPSQVKTMTPFGGPHLLRVTTSAHDRYGYMTKKHDTMAEINHHLAAKIDSYSDEIALVTTDIQPGADTIVIGYGISAGAVNQAVHLIRQDGEKISLLTIYSLWPVPEKAILEAIDGPRRIIVVEMNLGLYRREIERLARPDQQVIGVNRLDGKLISPDEIIKKVLLK